jgi:hypothetical protein
MMKQLFLAGILLAAGLFFVLSDILKLPTMKTAKAMLGAGKGSKKAAKTIEAWIMSGAVRLLPRFIVPSWYLPPKNTVSHSRIMIACVARLRRMRSKARVIL